MYQGPTAEEGGIRGMQMIGKLGKRITSFTAVMAVLSTMGCSAQFSQHGYVPLEEDLQQIVPGVDTRASVEELIGVPTTSGAVRESGYYYIQSRVRAFAWMRPRVVDREILAVTFAEDDVVENIITYGLEDGNVVPLVQRVTQTASGDISFLRQLFGNIGGLDASSFAGN